MLLPDMFDEKVALMGQDEEFSESRTGEQGTLIALTRGQLVTLFATGPDGRAAVAPVEVVLDDVLDDAKAAAGGKVRTRRTHSARQPADSREIVQLQLQQYQSARIILHAPGNSDCKRPQLADADRPTERDAAGATRTRTPPNITGNTARRRPWTLGIASTPALPLPRIVSKTPSRSLTPPGADTLVTGAEREQVEGGEDGEDGEDGEGESDRMEAPVIGWFGGVTRWASKLWSAKRAERTNTPRV